jgi:hypothetical protein
MMIMVAIEALSQRVKALEQVVQPSINTVFKPPAYQNHRATRAPLHSYAQRLLK